MLAEMNLKKYTDLVLALLPAQLKDCITDACDLDSSLRLNRVDLYRKIMQEAEA